MKLWLSKNGEVPLREQLTRQIILAIVSGDVRAGERLPSVREIALRYGIHQNTVSAAYRWLEENGWVEARRGSGVFVSELSPQKIERASTDANFAFDELVTEFFNKARQIGFNAPQIKSALIERFSQPPPERLIVVEQDEELRKILVSELESFVELPIYGAASANEILHWNGTLVLTINQTLENLPENARQIRLKFNSPQSEMRGKNRPHKNELIGVVSRWEQFLKWTKTMLVAAGIESEQILLRDARVFGWQKGLNSCAFIIADSFTANEMLTHQDTRVFRLISSESLNELESLLL